MLLTSWNFPLKYNFGITGQDSISIKIQHARKYLGNDQNKNGFSTNPRICLHIKFLFKSQFMCVFGN